MDVAEHLVVRDFDFHPDETTVRVLEVSLSLCSARAIREGENGS